MTGVKGNRQRKVELDAGSTPATSIGSFFAILLPQQKGMAGIINAYQGE